MIVRGRATAPSHTKLAGPALYNLSVSMRALAIAFWISWLMVATASAQNAPSSRSDRSAPQAAPVNNHSAALVPPVPKTPEGIVDYLVPDNLAYPGRLDRLPKADAVNALTKAQASAMGPRADSIAFLLLLLGQNVDANRQRLFDSLRECRPDPDNCNDQVIEYLGNLYSRGDNLVIEPLLDAMPNADSVVAEELGSTLEDMISGNARPFMTALARRTPAQQRAVCHLVAAGDGGGMPEDTAAEVTDALEKLAREVGPVATAAMACLNQVKAFVPQK